MIRGEVAIAVAAQIATLPILAGAFQRISLISLPANVLAAPTIPPLMALGAALAAVGFLPGIDVLLGWAAWLVSSVLLAAIEWSASLPGGGDRGGAGAGLAAVGLVRRRGLLGSGRVGRRSGAGIAAWHPAGLCAGVSRGARRVAAGRLVRCRALHGG